MLNVDNLTLCQDTIHHDLNVPGVDTSISQRSFYANQTSNVLIHIKIKSEVGTVIYISCDVLSVPYSLVITCWERANLLTLLYVMVLLFLSLSHKVSRAKFGT